ncbi:protein DDB_G0276689 [Condylostylus longicornis]|uniref:protein DDB_G0276689 n=1 Tax=Condylostylus longicornis TaxID=2530218 RepID=UPI00244DDD87|nr:protein DDB_G0276689 [Condylostylus longicornis]
MGKFFALRLFFKIFVILNILFLINCDEYDSISTFQLQTGYNKPLDFVTPQLYINGNNAVKTMRKTKQLFNNYVGKLKQLLKDSKRLESPEPIYNFYYEISISIVNLERNTKKFYQTARSESLNLLGSLKKIQLRYIKPPIKDELSDYYHEMDQFMYVFITTIDNFDEFIIEQLRRIRMTYENVANIQKDILGRQKLLQEDWCQTNYKQFLLLTTSQIYKCSTANMKIVYDVFAISKLNIYYLIQQLEHRLQKVFNCFEKKNYQLYCRFIKESENEFENIFNKLSELLIYNDKQKLNRNLLMKGYQKNNNYDNKNNNHNGKNNKNENYNNNTQEMKEKIYCLPENYPNEQLMDGLQACFSYWD